MDDKVVKNREVRELDGETYEEVTSSGWIPKAAGDIIKGVFIEKRSDIGKFKSNVYSLDQGDNIIDFFGSTVLDDKMKVVTIGEKIAVEFLGLKKSDDEKSEYKDYRIYKLKK